MEGKLRPTGREKDQCTLKELEKTWKNKMGSNIFGYHRDRGG
jgi:hypothetical protein